MSPAIELKQLRKEFGAKTAVRDISLQVKEGALFSLLGVNGAGKTTTIRILSGLSKPTSGEAYILGKNVKEQLEQIKPVSAVSPQETSVASNLTVYENLEFMARIYGLQKDEAAKRTEALLKRFSLEEMKNSKARILSGGWQRRLSIAMALISSPRILFLDEPTLGLDVLARRELWDILKSLKGKITIILTTHYMEEAEELSDQVAVMADGEIKACGSVKELKRRTGEDTLEKAFIRIVHNQED